ncbi:hypothetical protein CEXT_8271 [Caerostris extrusa]|uniref:Uncharacterized protein n=1 Tax=Caerostris extrusa TaxID=172846 RepID=A0AAV4Y8I0_CAEEX|nr:hypothetical protein CEXT_8271 [Caerostris extrusa]
MEHKRYNVYSHQWKNHVPNSKEEVKFNSKEEVNPNPIFIASASDTIFPGRREIACPSIVGWGGRGSPIVCRVCQPSPELMTSRRKVVIFLWKQEKAVPQSRWCALRDSKMCHNCG